MEPGSFLLGWPLLLGHRFSESLSKFRPHGIRASPGSSAPQIITGLYGSPTTSAQIVIHDAAVRPSWLWSEQDGKSISSQLRACLYDVCKIKGIFAVHALLWDDRSRVLWAAGNDRSPLIKGSTSIVNAYKYTDGSFQPKPISHIITSPARLWKEWGAGTLWCNGPHDMAPVPDQRRLLITTDLDIQIYDLGSQTFQHGEVVAQQFLEGTQPVDGSIGPDRTLLLRSDIKSISILETGDTLSGQSQWDQTFGNPVNYISSGNKQPNIWNRMLYRSRWSNESTLRSTNVRCSHRAVLFETVRIINASKISYQSSENVRPKDL